MIERLGAGFFTGLSIGAAISIMVLMTGNYQLVSSLLVILEMVIPLSVLGLIFEKLFLRFGSEYQKMKYFILYWVIVFPCYRVLVDWLEYLRTAFSPSYYGHSLSLIVFIGLQAAIGVVFTFGFLMIYSLIQRVLLRKARGSQ